MKSNRFHILELRRFLQSRDFYITKTVKRKDGSNSSVPLPARIKWRWPSRCAGYPHIGNRPDSRPRQISFSRQSRQNRSPECAQRRKDSARNRRCTRREPDSSLSRVERFFGAYRLKVLPNDLCFFWLNHSADFHRLSSNVRCSSSLVSCGHRTLLHRKFRR